MVGNIDNDFETAAFVHFIHV